MRIGSIFVLGFGILIASAAFGQSCGTTTSTTNPVPAGAYQAIVPHVTTGSGFVTKFTIVNLAASANQIVFNNISQAGTPIDTTTCTIPANGTLRIATPEANRFSAGETHWAMVGSQQPVGVNLFFELIQQGGTTPVNTVGFNDVNPKSNFTLPVELQSGPTFHTLGLAVANPNATATTVTVNLLDAAAVQRGTATLNLAAYGQTAVDLGSTFSSVVTSTNFIGSLTLTTSNGNQISAVGVGDDVGPFFSSAPMRVASGSGSNLAATMTLSSSEAAGNINAGTCTQKGITVTGATTAMPVVISPAGDPTTNGLSDVVWNAWVDSANHVTAQFCKFAKLSASPVVTQTFNIRVITSSQSSAAGILTVPSGTAINEATCITQGTLVSGATATSAVEVTPAVTTSTVGLPDIQWSGFVDKPGHVTAELCRASAGNLLSTAPLSFNIGVLN